ncbi:MAG: hypothetical protein ABI634_15375 [Acidobacteriota bacterium]
MRLVDWVLRQGHLDETALTEAVLSGDRPRHIDQCDRCASRMLAISRWLDDVKDLAVGDADAAFPTERLAAQQSQIMRRLEQADEPARVLEFPLPSARVAREPGGRRVAAAWVGVAAAAGLVIGIFGGHLAARHSQPSTPAGQTAVATPQPASLQDSTDDSSSRPSDRSDGASLLDLDLEGFIPNTLRAFDEATPRLVSSRYTVASAR